MIRTIGKPNGSGERPVCKAPTPYRAHCKARKWLVDDWESLRKGPWDTACRGSSAVRAATIRELGHEVARDLNLSSAAIL